MEILEGGNLKKEFWVWKPKVRGKIFKNKAEFRDKKEQKEGLLETN